MYIEDKNNHYYPVKILNFFNHSLLKTEASYCLSYAMSKRCLIWSGIVTFVPPINSWTTSARLLCCLPTPTLSPQSITTLQSSCQLPFFINIIFCKSSGNTCSKFLNIENKNCPACKMLGSGGLSVMMTIPLKSPAPWAKGQ